MLPLYMTRILYQIGSMSLQILLLVLLIIPLGVLSSNAQTQDQFAPYYGKNRVKYDKFDWHIYETDHFEIYYYPELEQHLERVAGYAESAYQQISADLRHELGFVVPLVVFKTHSEFEQQNIFPGQIGEGVGAFAEPQRDRIVLPIDEPPDGLYRLITHELTHIFMYDIVPRSLVRSTIPLWVDEGIADYLADVWRPLDMMTVRDVSISDSVPSMTNFDGYGGFANARVVYNLGHAVFEFIEDRWEQEGVRQFLLGLRRSSIGGGGDVYSDTLDLTAEEFDDEFRRYLDERFESFRDKERPVDYGRNLAPDPLRSKYPIVYSIEGSPTGELIAAVAFNRKDGEFDIVLLSAATGEIVDNVTEGFDQSMGFEYIPIPGQRFNTVSWISWAPQGDRMAYFVRKGKYKTLIIHNIITKQIERRIALDMVDEPESPDFSPDGKKVIFSALTDAIGDIYQLDLETEEITNLTQDDLSAYAPLYAPNGQSIVYLARVSGNNKYFSLDLESGERRQLTFGTHDEAGGQFINNRKLVFSSTAVDPAQTVDPDVARDGEIFNIWTLNLEDGELQQLTDSATGNVNPVVIRPTDETGPTEKIAFITYYETEYGLHSVITDEPLYTALAQDFGGPSIGSVIDFQAPITHTLIRDNDRQKGAFEKMFMSGRPPINLGMTSGGMFVGGTGITFTDVLGDQQFSAFIYSVAQYRTLGASYQNLAGRLQFALQGFSQEQFFFNYNPGFAFDQGLGFLDRDQAIATRKTQGGTFTSIYPFDRFRRLELSAGLYNFEETYNNDLLQQQAEAFQMNQFGNLLFRNGNFMPLGLAYVQETTVFRQYGPLSGNTLRAGYTFAPPAGSFLLSRQTVEVDGRTYLRLGENGVLAFRAQGFKSWGDFPDFKFFGGNHELRGYDYYQFIGHNVLIANLELRFPLIEAMATPIGVLGGVRGTFFINFGTASFNGSEYDAFSNQDTVVRGINSFVFNEDLQEAQPSFGPPIPVSGLRLINGRASYGFGLTTYAIGFPIHIDWSWRTLFNRTWEDLVFAQLGGSEDFRRVRVSLWIGQDF